MARSNHELFAEWETLQTRGATSFLVSSVLERTLAEIKLLELLLENGCKEIPGHPMSVTWLLQDRRELLAYIQSQPSGKRS